MQAILAQLREDDEMSQLAGLTELCEYLSISTGAGATLCCACCCSQFVASEFGIN